MVKKNQQDGHMWTCSTGDLLTFVFMSSNNLFANQQLFNNFSTISILWSNRDNFMAKEVLINTLAVTNDQAGVALIQDTAKSGRFRCEDQLQYALQVIEQNREKFPDAKKSTLLKKL